MTTALQGPEPHRAGRLRLVPSADGVGEPQALRQEKGPELATLARAPGRPPTSAPRLERLLHRLGAARLALVRFKRESASFEIVAAAGEPFLSPGVSLPIAASTFVLAASESRHALQSPEQSSRPLDRIAAALGLRCGLGIPLTVAGTPVGALTVLWDVDQPPITDPCEALNGDYVELVQMLVAPEPGQSTVLACHEDRLVAEGLAHVAGRRLGGTSDIACTVADALAALAARPPDLIVLSDHFSPSEGPAQTARRLRAAGAAAPILLLAHSDSRQSFDSAVQAGASGYLPLAAAAERLPDTAATLLEGRSALHQASTTPTVPRLTAREHQVLLGFERGLADKQIARELDVAISTVKTHARAIYAKLEATSRTAALHKARLTGLV
jgi:DNA-binding NarL/FixJ family response regulator